MALQVDMHGNDFLFLLCNCANSCSSVYEFMLYMRVIEFIGTYTEYSIFLFYSDVPVCNTM